ncbi:MAG: hypothetical protein WD793_12710, partial [Steroidobacteraceae bacterium]
MLTPGDGFGLSKRSRLFRPGESSGRKRRDHGKSNRGTASFASLALTNRALTRIFLFLRHPQHRIRQPGGDRG